MSDQDLHCLLTECSIKIWKNESKKAGKDQELIQSSPTPDPGYQWESNKLAIDITNES